MARIRSIKPDFWQDEKLAPLVVIDRLVFLGLISQADDAGRLVDNVRLIDGLLFPQTDDSSRESLDTLARLKRILRYSGPSGQRLIQIVRWKDHQKVDNPGSRLLPPPPAQLLAAALDSEFAGGSREDIASVSLLEVGSGKKDVGNGKREAGALSSTARVREALLEGDRPAFDTLLTRASDPEWWVAEIEAMLAGMPGHHKATPEKIGEALRDMAANGKLKNPNLRQFRRYVRGADAEVDGGNAARLWELIKSRGLLQRHTDEEITTEINALVAEGSVKDAKAFRKIFNTLDLDTLRRAQTPAFAVKHIAEKLNGSVLRVA